MCSPLVYLPASPSSDSFFTHYLPPRKLLLNKQTNPLPLDTQLGCGDLLRLSGRILSNAVASVNKRKAPEARGVTYLFKVWIISLTRHSGFHPLSGVWTACGSLKPDLCGICRLLLPVIYPNCSSKIKWDQYVIDMQAIMCPCLSDLLDNVQRCCLNWTVKKHNNEKVPTNVSQGDFSERTVGTVEPLNICAHFLDITSCLLC